MSPATWTKRYDDPERCKAACRHFDWLDGLHSGTRLPALHTHGPQHLTFEHLGTRQPEIEDLVKVADALGQLHAAAHARVLHQAQLDQPLRVSGLVILDFVGPRSHVLRQVGLDTVGLPVALYKDANIRNFLLAEDEVALVDFDDLTLAPFGYDLAKLVVSTAMTHGALPNGAESAVLDGYNQHVADIPGAVCTREQFTRYAEVHHLLTAPYLGRNGYRYTWPEVRPTRMAR